VRCERDLVHLTSRGGRSHPHRGILFALCRCMQPTSSAVLFALLSILSSGCVVGTEGDLSEEEQLDENTTEILAACVTGTAFQPRVQDIIRSVWGSDFREGQAIRVAKCESGPWGTEAVNGQYRGLFQMGLNERRTYGHGPCAITQARAAHRYFVASGRDWSPWACKP
jgi:hypothetical protein